jgi:hypothetical protein
MFVIESSLRVHRCMLQGGEALYFGWTKCKSDDYINFMMWLSKSLTTAAKS